MLKQRCVRWLGMALRTYALVVLIVMFLENFLVYPAPKYPAGFWDTKQLGCEDVFFVSEDGTKLHGWYFPTTQARGHLLFFHGNGEHLGYLGDEMSQLRDDYRLNVFVFDYRGYGRSEGSPNERGVVADAIAARNWFTKQANLGPEDIILMGRSIGGAIAVDVAARDGAKGIVLWNTFPSLPAVAARHFPWLPVKWLMRNRYEAISKIPKYRGPLLQTHGTADRIVGFDLAERLFAAATTPDKKFVPIMNGDHNDPSTNEFIKALEQFLDRICRT